MKDEEIIKFLIGIIIFIVLLWINSSNNSELSPEEHEEKYQEWASDYNFGG